MAFSASSRPTPIDLELNIPLKLQKISEMYDEHMPENNGFDEKFMEGSFPNQGGRFLYPKFRISGLSGKGAVLKMTV